MGGKEQTTTTEEHAVRRTPRYDMTLITKTNLLRLQILRVQPLFGAHLVRTLTDVPDTNAVSSFHNASNQEQKGKIYDKKPFKFMCQKGKSYFWCSCGHSKNQPFCDGTHKSPFLKITMRPVRFVPTETKEYWFCNCKQTSSRPFCDGTHRDPEIQEKK